MKARIYTKTGDLGQTSLVGGTRISKSDRRLEAYGTLDELNSAVGVVRAQLVNVALGDFAGPVESLLQSVQNCLFNIGSHLACEDQKLLAHLPGISELQIAALEHDMDRMENELPALKNFILPGGSLIAAQTHVARTICRRAERECVRVSETAEVARSQLVYLNRLSDWLFLLARAFNARLNVTDLPWSK